MAQQVTNPTSIHEDLGSTLGLTQWVKRPGVAVSCGVGHRGDWIWPCYGCGVGQQLQLQFDPWPSICCRCVALKRKGKKIVMKGLKKTMVLPHICLDFMHG